MGILTYFQNRYLVHSDCRPSQYQNIFSCLASQASSGLVVAICGRDLLSVRRYSKPNLKDRRTLKYDIHQVSSVRQRNV